MRTIVFGFPRSGTTALMRALEAGGLTTFWQPTENDRYNPGGSREVAGDYVRKKGYPYITETDGKAFKMFHSSVYQIDNREPTQVIIIERDPIAIAESIERLGGRAHKLRQAGYYDKHMTIARERFRELGIKTYTLRFDDLLANARRELARLVGEGLQIDATEAAKEVKPEISQGRNVWPQ